MGVAAPRFTWYAGDVYLPLKIDAEIRGRRYDVDLLLRPGVTHESGGRGARPRCWRLCAGHAQQFPEHFRVKVEGLNEWVVRGIGGTLYLLFGAVALLLAIGCGNVSILLLARGTARQQELGRAGRGGASRSRLVGQLLTESLLLAAIGAALGVLTRTECCRPFKGCYPGMPLRPRW